MTICKTSLNVFSFQSVPIYKTILYFCIYWYGEDYSQSRKEWMCLSVTFNWNWVCVFIHKNKISNTGLSKEKFEQKPYEFRYYNVLHMNMFQTQFWINLICIFYLNLKICFSCTCCSLSLLPLVSLLLNSKGSNWSI